MRQCKYGKMTSIAFIKYFQKFVFTYSQLNSFKIIFLIPHYKALSRDVIKTQEHCLPDNQENVDQEGGKDGSNNPQ